ncbi:MAG: Fe-S cluster assembly protein SufD [Planctomycetota bacterium]|jgi:Fe-S cluster assembly protein SufD
MTAAPFVRAFEALEREGGGALHALRKRALARFEELGLPTTKQEEWRFTNVAPLAKEPFPLGRPTTNGIADVDRLALAPGLVFVDGHFRADLSTVPEGVRASSLGEALRTDGDFVQRHLGPYEDRPFVALNTAFLEDGAFLHVPRGVVLAEPLHVLFVGTDKACHPRNLYVVEESAAAAVVEAYVSLGDAAHLTNTVSEAAVRANGALEHYQLQLENERAYHVATLLAHQERDSRFTSHSHTLGGALTRNDVTVALDGEGGLCTLNGLILTRGVQHADNHTWIQHRKPHCESHELYKGVLADRSSGVFSGHIHVYPDAQKTDAFQASANLLLSDEAVVDAKPQLEIYADDVKCSHGSTTGQVDPQALFYLRTRGIQPERARNMLIRAFAGEVTERLGVAAARERVERLLTERLPGGA